MTSEAELYRLTLMGPLRLHAPDGRRISVRTRKGAALLAMLAVSSDGARPRVWLQDRLWGSRDRIQARASLRQELLGLRRLLGGEAPLLTTDNDEVALDLNRVVVDARDGASVRAAAQAGRDFLEGFDIPGEEGFEDWLRAQRSELCRVAEAAGNAPVPERMLDLSAPAPGFGGRAAVAVLPLINLTGDRGNDYLAEGLAEELIERLSRLRWLPVIARSSAFSLASQMAEPALVGQRLGAKYVLQGRLRRADGEFSLAVELCDSLTHQTVWSQRFEIGSPMDPAVQAQLARDLVAALDGRIDQAEQASARRRRQSDLNVDELIWRGRWHVNRLTRLDADRARELFTEALRLEPQSPEALIQATWAMGRSIWAQRGGQIEILEMRDLAQRAIRADPEDGRAHWLAGVAEMWLRRPSRARLLYGRAISLNPSLSEAYAQLGDLQAWDNEPEAALTSIHTALRLSPNDLLVFAMLSTIGLAHWMLGNFAKAVDYAEESIIRRPGYWFGHVVKIAALVSAGRSVEAREARRELLGNKPSFGGDEIEWVPFTDPRWSQALKDALAAAEPG